MYLNQGFPPLHKHIGLDITRVAVLDTYERKMKDLGSFTVLNEFRVFPPG